MNVMMKKIAGNCAGKYTGWLSGMNVGKGMVQG